ncbi:hypothetical protein PFLUV_G00083840 [Perca fluviatilis]|uniref:C2H2-type domain-containing protein n=1 Tax=Perca fluviatilis TaxID=8168 RepID=A0A6A5FDQ0_PERFL|nr:hypothetical protein PFLUV_G00083840 [Perca fluviatilis]
MQRTVHAPLQFYEKVARVMNSDQERPYVCNAPGCSQRFPTEDHLMIHRHKHEMTLKFPSIKNDNMLSDQTPTPTRFLKNCEEVGLFSELDCSIEQEFCKAQEEEDSKQSISLHGQTGQGQHQQSHSRMGNHDTSIVIQQALPSPQSSSVITQAPSTNRQIGPVPGSLSSLLHLRNRQRQPLPASMPGTLPDPTMPGSSAVLMPMERQMSMGSNMMGMQGPTHSSSCSSTHIPSMHSEAKLRLKAALSHHPGTIANGNMNSMGHMMEMITTATTTTARATARVDTTTRRDTTPIKTPTMPTYILGTHTRPHRTLQCTLLLICHLQPSRCIPRRHCSLRHPAAGGAGE